MSEELMAAADRIAELQAEVHRLNQERQGNCLAGQSMMEEAYDMIESLKAEIASLKSELKEWANSRDGVMEEVMRLKSDKRELFTALEYAVRFVRDADMDYIEAHILKHKEGL